MSIRPQRLAILSWASARSARLAAVQGEGEEAADDQADHEEDAGDGGGGEEGLGRAHAATL